MSKMFLMAALAVALPLSGVTRAATPPASPLIGRWAVDTSRLPMPPEARPRSVTLTFASADAGKMSVGVDMVNADGTTLHSVNAGALDGKPFTVADSPEADAAAMEQPRPDALVIGLSKSGVQASTRIYTAAPDGRTMTEIVAYYGDDGRPAMRVHYFRRVGI